MRDIAQCLWVSNDTLLPQLSQGPQYSAECKAPSTPRMRSYQGLLLTAAISVHGSAAVDYPESPVCQASRISLPNTVVVSIDRYTKDQVIPLPNTVASCGGPSYK